MTPFEANARREAHKTATGCSAATASLDRAAPPCGPGSPLPRLSGLPTGARKDGGAQRSGRGPPRYARGARPAGALAERRAAGAGLVRSARREAALTVGLPVDVPAGVRRDAVRGLAEGALLASYRYRLGADPPGKAPKLRTVTMIAEEPVEVASAVAWALAVAEATYLARDLTNTPSDRKSPAWF